MGRQACRGKTEISAKEMETITTLIHARLFMCTKQHLRQVCQVSPRTNRQHAELSALVTATASTHAHVLSTLSEAFQQRSGLLSFKAKLSARLHFLLYKHAAHSLTQTWAGHGFPPIPTRRAPEEQTSCFPSPSAGRARGQRHGDAASLSFNLDNLLIKIY